jgi:hypothetical protein
MRDEIKDRNQQPKMKPGTAFKCPHSGKLYIVVAIDTNFTVSQNGVFALRVHDNTVTWWSGEYPETTDEPEEILGNDVTLVVK